MNVGVGRRKEGWDTPWEGVDWWVAELLGLCFLLAAHAALPVPSVFLSTDKGSDLLNIRHPVIFL